MKILAGIDSDTDAGRMFATIFKVGGGRKIGWGRHERAQPRFYVSQEMLRNAAQVGSFAVVSIRPVGRLLRCGPIIVIGMNLMA